MVASILTIVIVVFVFSITIGILLTWVGVRLCKKGNGIGMILGFLGTNIIGLLITALVYANATSKGGKG